MKAIKALAILISVLCMASKSWSVETVDIQVAYDTSSLAWLAADGRTPQAFAEAQVEKMNLVVSNSGLQSSFLFRLAGVYQGAFDCSAMSLSSILAAATEGAGAEWKALRSARDAAAADIVLMLVDPVHASSQVGDSIAMQPMVNGVRQWGLSFPQAAAWLEWFAPRAYGVCAIGAADAGYTMAHEAGHIMGAGHSELLNPAVFGPGPQLFKYSAAYMYQSADGGLYSTVMGYPTTGYADGGSYEVLPYFSSPDVRNPYTGEILGDATHDNVSTLRETCSKVAAFRKAKSGGGGRERPQPAPAPDVSFAKTQINGVLVSDGNLAGLVQFTVAKTAKGYSKVSGFIMELDGKKKAFKAVKLPVSKDGDLAVVESDFEVKGKDAVLHARLASDCTISEGSFGLGVQVVASAWGELSSDRPHFRIEDAVPVTIGGVPVLNDVTIGDTSYHLIPDGEGEPIVVNGGRWTVPAKSASVKFKRNKETKESELVIDTGADGSKTNMSALKLTYAQKTGSFKGSFTIFADMGGKLKKLKFTVTGIVAGGQGVGIAVCKQANLTLNVSVR